MSMLSVRIPSKQMRNRKRTPSRSPRGHSKNGENIKVLVRVRPPATPVLHESDICVKVDKDSKCISIAKYKNSKRCSTYTFDHVAKHDSTQKEMMKHVGKPITNKVLEGYNGTIFAYGQTGSGKTYTMSGKEKKKDSKTNVIEKRDFGLMPNIFHYLFRQIEKRQSNDTEYSVKVSCCEIYNDHITDLLHKKKGLSLREDVRGKRFFVAGLSEKDCKSAQEMFNYVGIARWFRETKATKSNKYSSRSHLIFTVILTKRTKDVDCDDPSRKVHSTVSRLNLVDLAGSERAKRTKAQKERAKEAQCINSSLTHLGLVIKKLVDKEEHIPYNNSKLTKLLKDSLGGTSMTFVIANISPSSVDMQQSLSTLQFADRAKRIKNAAKRNDGVHLSLKALKEQNSKFVGMVEELTAKYERAHKKFKMQRRKSVELAGKLDVASKENTDLQSMVSKEKAQKTHALELATKALREQEAQIAALQRQLAENTMHRTISDDRFISKNVNRFPHCSFGKKQRKEAPAKRSSSTPSKPRSYGVGPLGTITGRMRSNENSCTNSKMDDDCRESQCLSRGVSRKLGGDACDRSSVMDMDMERGSMVITTGGGPPNPSGDYVQKRLSSEALEHCDIDFTIERATRDLTELKASPYQESGNPNTSLLSKLGSESMGSFYLD